MGRAKLYLNDVSIPIIQYEIKLEGERAVDEAKFFVTPCQNINTNDTIRIVQDAYQLCGLSTVWTFQGHTLNDSGNGIQPTGSTGTPRSDVIYEFEDNTNNCGFRNITTVENGCLTYVTGKPGAGTKAACFSGCEYLTITEKCQFNYDITTAMSFNFWINTSTSCAASIIAKKATGIGSVGYDVSIDGCGKVIFDLLNTACSDELKVTSDFAVNDGNWHMVTVTYSGIVAASSVKMYNNSIQGSFITNSDTLASPILNCVVPSIGAYADGSSKVTAIVDETRIIAKEINACEVVSLYSHEIFDYVTGKFGEAARFNGIDTSFSVPHDSRLSFSANFDIYIWATWAGTGVQYMMTKRTLGGNGIAISINRFSCGDIVGEVDGKFVTASGTFNDSTYHLIRLRRIGSIVELFVDDSSKDTVTQASNMLLITPLTVGRNHNTTGFYLGDMNILRIYNGTTLPDTSATKIFTNRNATVITKFGGQVTKVSKEMDHKDVVAQSFGKALGETEIRGEVFLCRSPEFIVEDLVSNNTCMITHVHGSDSGTIITTYTADGKMIDIIQALTGLTGKSFHTDGVNQFHLHDSQFVCSSSVVFTHGVNSSVFVTKFDDTEIINDLVVLGENKRYSTCCQFVGDGCQSTFVINSGPIVSKVVVTDACGAAEQEPEEDYVVSTVRKTLIFEPCSIPPAFCLGCCNPCNICISYEYELPLYIRGIKQSSININGRHAKRLIAPWISNRQDGIKFINGYLNKFQNVRTNIEVKSPTFVNTIEHGHVVTVSNTIKSINGTFVVKGITHKYPAFTSSMDMGEFTFDDLEYDKQIAQKIHDLEGAITTIKEIRDFESFEEQMGICDSFLIQEACACGTLFTECMALTDSFCINEVFTAVYSVGQYSVAIYGTDPPGGGFSPSGFTISGYVTS